MTLHPAPNYAVTKTSLLAAGAGLFNVGRRDVNLRLVAMKRAKNPRESGAVRPVNRTSINGKAALKGALYVERRDRQKPPALATYL